MSVENYFGFEDDSDTSEFYGRSGDSLGSGGGSRDSYPDSDDSMAYEDADGFDDSENFEDFENLVPLSSEDCKDCEAVWRMKIMSRTTCRTIRWTFTSISLAIHCT